MVTAVSGLQWSFLPSYPSILFASCCCGLFRSAPLVVIAAIQADFVLPKPPCLLLRIAFNINTFPFPFLSFVVAVRLAMHELPWSFAVRLLVCCF